MGRASPFASLLHPIDNAVAITRAEPLHDTAYECGANRKYGFHSQCGRSRYAFDLPRYSHHEQEENICKVMALLTSYCSRTYSLPRQRHHRLRPTITCHRQRVLQVPAPIRHEAGFESGLQRHSRSARCPPQCRPPTLRLPACS